MPFILLVLTIGLWQMPFFADLFKPGNALASTNIVWTIPGLDQLIIQQTPIVANPTALGADWKWLIIQNPGTAILLAALLSIIVLRANATQVIESASETIKEMSIPVLTIGLVLAFAIISKNSGQAATMGLALAHTGSLFPFFSPFIGWVGVFLTGSDTSSNLLFGPLQQVTAKALDMPEVLFMAANTVGGVVGKMISPQSIAIACAAVGLVGRESELFRFTLKYSLGFVVFIGIWTAIIAYIIPGIIVG